MPVLDRWVDLMSKLAGILAVACICLMLLPACDKQVDGPREEIGGLRVNTVLGGDTDDNFLRAERPRAFRFPDDHGAHPGYRSEWWYLTAVLQDPTGEHYGVQFTLFRQALTPQPLGEGPWKTGLAYLAHLAVTDVRRGTHHQAQRFARGHPQLADVTLTPGFNAFVEDWSLKAGDDTAREFVLRAQDKDFGVRLNVEQTQAIVLQGEDGLSRKGVGSASYYYSMPRLTVDGEIELNGQSLPVQGLAWFDREWSTSVLADHLQGWDWFALQLDDGRSIMAFRLRRRDGTRDDYDHGIVVQPPPTRLNDASHQLTQGVISAPDPGVSMLTPQHFTLTPERYWRDQNDVAWPVAWRLKIGEEELVIEAMLDNQLMQQTLTYWEGIVGVRDRKGQWLGRGYMELTGYGVGDKDE